MFSLINFLTNISPLSDDAIADITARVKVIDLPRQRTVLRAGAVCHYLYFVNSGLLRLFYYRNGKDITDYFATEQSFIGGIDSFFSRVPSRKQIETLEASQLLALSFTDMNLLLDRHHDFERVARLLSVQAFLSMQERLYALQFHPAKQRYDDLVTANPTLLQRVPLGFIASFLGVTQVTLSRIRGQR